MRTRTLVRLGVVALGLAAASAPAQTTVLTWSSATSGQWTTASNWSPATMPNHLSLHDALISATGSAYTVTASGASNLSVRKLDVTSANATVLFNFSSTSTSLSLGLATSTISAGLVEFHTGSGIYGQGSGLTSLNVSSGAQLLFSTSSGTPNLSSLTLANAGTVQATSGILSISTGTAVNNQSGGLLHANGAEIVFQGGTTLSNSGTLRATGSAGILRFYTTLTTANLGTVDLVSGGHAYLAGTLTNTSATLNAPGAGSYELLGGTIVGGNVASGALKFTNSGGTLDGVTLANTLTLPASSGVYFKNGTSFASGASSLGSNSYLYWQQTGTLANAALTFSGGSYLYISNVNSALTLDSASSATGQVQIYSDGSNGTALTNQGNITHTSSGVGYLNARTFTNSGSISNTGANSSLYVGSTSSSFSTTNTGTITVNASGATTYLDGTFINTGGTLTATQGSFQFRGTNLSTNLNGGTINIASGAHAYLAGTLTNTSATLNAPTSGQYELLGGTINGGTTAPSALTFTSSGGYLSGVSINDNLTLPANAYVRFTNNGTNTSFTGATGTFGTNAGVYWQQVGTLSGKSFNLANGAYLYVAGANNALTLASSTSVGGTVNIYSDGSSGTAITNQGNLTHSANYGRIDAPALSNTGTISNTSANTYLIVGSTASGYTTTNTGTISINASGATTYIDGTFINTGGTLTATQGSFQFRGTNSTGNLNGGTLNIASGAHAYLAGTLTNTSATLNAPTSGQYELLGGTITSGTIAPNALTFTGSGGYLNGVSLNDNLTLPANSYVRFTNDGTSNASFTGATGTFGNNAGLYWQQVGTLTGKSFTLGNGAYLYVANANNTLTLAPSTSVTGTVNIYSDGSSGTAITNQGNITHSANYGRIDAPTLSNTGTITNTAANTYLSIGSTYSGYTTTNTGNITVNASGATTYLDGTFNNTGGTLTATQGSFQFRGANTTGNLNGGTLNIASGAHAYLAGTLTNTSATLNAPTSGQYELLGGTITSGTIAPNALTFTGSGGYLNGVSLNDNLTLPANSYVRFTNDGTSNASFTGATGTLGNNAGLYWQQVGTLTGKSFTLGNGAYLYVANANNTLTLAPSTSVTGTVNIYSDGSSGTAITNQGNITHSANYGRIDAPTLSNTGTISNTSANTYLIIGSTYSGYTTTNTGTISINASGATTYLDGNFITSGGTLTATQGSFLLRGTNTTGNLNGGTININTANGGHVLLNGTLNNASATLNAPTSGQYELYGGTIQGGSIATGALTFTGSGGTLNGVTLSGALSLPANSSVTFTNGTTLTGGTATLGTSSSIYWQQAGTLVNKALTFGSGAYLYLSGSSNALTLDSASTATGQVQIYSGGGSSNTITNQGNITHTSSGSGYLYASTLSNTGTIANTSSGGYLELGSTSSGYTTTNTGNIVVNGSGATIYLDGDFNNTGGTLTATQGNLIFRGNNTTAHLNGGTVNINSASGGHVHLNGTLDNSSATLNAPASGSYELYGGTINGGSIASGALAFTNYGGTLSGVTLLGSLNLSNNSAYVYVNNSTFNITSATFGASSFLYWQQAGQLSGTALTFGSNSLFYLSGLNAALTLDSASTATGQVQIYADGSAGTALTNQGNITHTSAGTGYLYARTFLNSGTIAATTGSLNLGTSQTGHTFTNTSSGTVRANGGNVFLNAPSGGQVQNFGKVDVQSGSLFTNGFLVNSGSSSVLSGAGTIVGNVGVAGGSIAPGNGGIGTLTFSNGTLNVTSAALLAVEIGGASSDKLVFSNPTGPVNIGAGLLSLSLTFLSPPTAGTTYNLVQITSGGSGITGYFAGLPNSGDQFAATYSGSTYYFSVNYSTNLYSLSVASIPEPSTWALLGLGVVALAAVRRRKK